MVELNFDMKQFDANIAELNEIASKYRGIKINGLDDYAGMDLAISAKSVLVSTRTGIQKKMKQLRDGANNFAKNVIAKENELVGIIEVVEDEIKAEIQKIEDEKERLKRLETLPLRLDDLKRIGLEGQYDEEFVLSMDYKSWCDFIICEKARIADELIQKAEEAKKEEQRQKYIKEAEERGRKEAEERLKKQQEIEEQRKAGEARTKEVMEAQKKREEEENIKKELSKEAYKEFRKKHGWTEATKEDYFEQKIMNKVILWKKCGEFSL